MATRTCNPTEHHFVKFDEARIFCERCGEWRSPSPVAYPVPYPYYVPYPVYQAKPWWGTTTPPLTYGSTSGLSTGNVLTTSTEHSS